METGKVENLAYFTSFQCTLIEIKRNTQCGLNTPSLFRGYCKSKSTKRSRGQKEAYRRTLMVGATAVSLVSVFEEQEEASK